MRKDIFENLYRQRAIEAFSLVKKAGEGLDETDEKMVRLKAMCRRLPAMIHENGLLTTLLFLEKKSEKESEKGSGKEPDKESNKELDKESDKGSDKVPDKESGKESDRESGEEDGKIDKTLGEGIVKWLEKYNALICQEEQNNNNGQSVNFLRYLIVGGSGAEEENFRMNERMLTREALEFTSWMKRCVEE